MSELKLSFTARFIDLFIGLFTVLGLGTKLSFPCWKVRAGLRGDLWTFRDSESDSLGDLCILREPESDSEEENTEDSSEVERFVSIPESVEFFLCETLAGASGRVLCSFVLSSELSEKVLGSIFTELTEKFGQSQTSAVVGLTMAD